MPLSIAEQLMHTTIRFTCHGPKGTSTGTAFFFGFPLEGQQEIPVVVTNKHVIEGAEVGEFHLTLADDAGEPIVGSHEKFTLFDFQKPWILHPDPKVDLAIMPVAALIEIAKQKGMNIFRRALGEQLIPTDDDVSKLSGIEDVTMIGYPNGIWDSVNNLPIVRRGITATSPKHDYCGLPIFVIDCACFPGSSGSPVLIFSPGFHVDAAGGINLGTGRLWLIGVLYAGPQHVAEGEIQVIDVPLQQIPISLSKIPNNLGFVVKAQKLKDFRELLIEKMKVKKD